MTTAPSPRELIDLLRALETAAAALRRTLEAAAGPPPPDEDPHPVPPRRPPPDRFGLDPEIELVSMPAVAGPGPVGTPRVRLDGRRRGRRT